jgi:3-oxoacyl-[acyl-carrier-protein] synthase III
MLQQSGFGIAVTGSGSCTPQVSLDNNGLAQIVDTSDEWIAARTGIRARRLADDRISLCDLATEASRRAIEMAQIAPTDIDLIILATSSPDDLFGSASKIQYQLGATKALSLV